MNWDAISGTAEVLGAIGVIGTLIYLAIELRKSTTATRQQSYHSIVTRRSEMFDGFGRDKETLSTIVAGWTGSDLESLDSLRFVWLMMNFMSHYQDIYMQFRVGTVETKVWEAEQRTLAAVLGQPGFLSWWNEAAQYFMPEFVEMVLGIEPVPLVVFDPKTRKWHRPGGLYEP